MKPLRLAVAGATGRTGRTVVQLAARDPAFTIAAAVAAPSDPQLGQDAGPVAGITPLSVAVTADIAVPCDVLIEFTLPAGCAAWAHWCAARAIPLVSGTTGLDQTQQATLHAAARRTAVLWAPNMSVGVNLLMTLVADLAHRLDTDWDVEICETHHRHKLDAPSGTARTLVDAVCAARHATAADKAIHGRSGTCGPRKPGEVGVHALRMGEFVGEHEVHFTSPTESLTLRHRAFARDAFAAGALRAARWLHGRPPGLYTMRDALSL